MITNQGRGNRVFLTTLSGILFLFSCGIGITNIGEIVEHPRDYAGKHVAVTGRVTETFSLLVIRYYLLKDDTGEIHVVTERPLPVIGEKIKTTGTVKEAFSIGTRSALVLVEDAQ